MFGNKNSGNIITSELLDEFETFKDLFNNSSMSAEALAESLGGVDDRILNYAKTCKNGAMTTQGFKTSLEGMTLSSKAATVAMKALSIAGNMLVFWGISKAIEMVTRAIDKNINRVKYANEALADSKSKYDETTQSIEDLQNEIDDCTESIKDLQSQADNGTISVTDEEQLRILKETNEELERQLKVKQELQLIAAEEAVDNADKTLGTYHQSKYIIDDNIYLYFGDEPSLTKNTFYTFKNGKSRRNNWIWSKLYGSL